MVNALNLAPASAPATTVVEQRKKTQADHLPTAARGRLRSGMLPASELARQYVLQVQDQDR